MVERLNHIDGQRKTPYNSTYPKGGVSCSKDSFVVNQTLVFQIKFSTNNPRHFKPPKRFQPF